MNRCERVNSDGLTCDYGAFALMHEVCGKTREAFCDTDKCHQFVGDLPIAKSPAVPSSGTPEPPARQTSLCDEVLGDTQASPELPLRNGSPKYHARMTVTGTWTEHGKPEKRVIQFSADGQEGGDLLAFLFNIEQAINSSASAYSLRAHVAAEES